MEIPSVVEDVLAEVDCNRYSLAHIRWPKLTVGAYWMAGLGTAAVSPLALQEPQRWVPFLLVSALTTVCIFLVMRRGVIAARSKADGRKLSGLGDVRRSVRIARGRDMRRRLAGKGYKTQDDVETLLKMFVSRQDEKPASDFQIPTPLKVVWPLLLGVIFTALGTVAGSKSVLLGATFLFVSSLVGYSVWLTALQPLLDSDRRKMLEARHLLEEVLIDMKRYPVVLLRPS